MKKPNVLFIMSDDHAANAVSSYGSRLADVFKTPNLDRLYEEGTLCENFYSTNAICTPARATIMTGQYGHINGVRTLSDPWNPDKGPNLAKLMQEAGYETALFGKWHLHCEPQGFDTFKYLSGEWGQGTYLDPEFNEDGKMNHRKGYVTDIVTEMTMDFLTEWNQEKPFYIMCHHKAPHDYWQYAERHEHLFDGMDIPIPDSLFEDRNHRCSGSRDYGSSVTPRSKVRSLYDDFLSDDYVTGQLEVEENMSFREKGIAAYQKYLKDYLRTVAAIDESVGSLMDKLTEIGQLDNTIIIYTSDQGMFLGEHDYQDKRWSYEESLRAPLLIRYPAWIPSSVRNRNLIANVDIAPTILDFCGQPVPESMQGISQKEVLSHEGKKDLRDYIYFRYWMHLAHRHDNPAHYGIRTEEYKLIFYYGRALDASGAIDEDTPQGYELYDMKKDPFELHNVFGEAGYYEVQNELIQRLADVKRELEDEDELMV